MISKQLNSVRYGIILVGVLNCVIERPVKGLAPLAITFTAITNYNI
jgi:hypothetical protein